MTITHLDIAQLFFEARWVVRTQGRRGQHARIEIEQDDLNRTHCLIFAEPPHGPADLHPLRSIEIAQ